MNKEKLMELRNKIIELDKRRVGALGLASLLASTPLVASAEEVAASRSDDKEYVDVNGANASSLTDEELIQESMASEKEYSLDLGDFIPVSQVKKANPISLEEYFQGVSQITKYLMNKFDVQDEEAKNQLIQKIECFYFVVSYDYFKEEIEKELVDGVNVNGNIYNVLFKTDTSIGEDETIELAKSLLKDIIEFNDSKIREINNIDDLIDYSIFCYNEHDRQAMQSIFKHWFNSHKNNTYDMDGNLYEGFKEITTLNAEEQKVNVDEMALSQKWLAQYGLGQNLMQAVRDYLQSHYNISQLTNYFVEESLKEKIWLVREDKVLFKDFNCLNDLEQWVFVYGQLYEFCVRRVDNDLNRAFQRTNEVSEKETDIEVKEDKFFDANNEQSQMTVEEYFDGVDKAKNHVTNHLKYDKELLQQIQCFYFINNCVFMKDIEEELVDGVKINGEIKTPIFITDMSKMDDMSGLQNFVYANFFLNVRGDYNQSVIRKTTDFSKIINLSNFCYNKQEEEYVCYLEKLWFESHKMDTFDEDKFKKLVDELDSLDESGRLSIGSKWSVKVGIGTDAMQVLRDYMIENYSNEELSKLYKIGELNRGQFYLKDNLSLDGNSSNELERLAYYFDKLWDIVYTSSSDEILEYFGEVCKVKTR